MLFIEPVIDRAGDKSAAVELSARDAPLCTTLVSFLILEHNVVVVCCCWYT